MIIFITGKSGAGKDTICNKLFNKYENLEILVPYTTRPMRPHEIDGVNYHFVNENDLEKYSGKILESRTYHTNNGDWIYFTADDIDRDKNYIYITTPEAVENLQYTCTERGISFIVVEIFTKHGTRLQRQIDRATSPIFGTQHVDYREICRRFISDEKDFERDGYYPNYIVDNSADDDGSYCMECFEEILMNEGIE